MPKPSAENRWADIDAARAHKGQFVRLDDDEYDAAVKEVKRRKLSSIPALLRAMLREGLGLPPKGKGAK